MATDADAGEPGRGSRWIRRLAIALAVVALLLVAAYVVVSSTAFLKGVILPRAGQSLHADISVEDASVSPFSHVTLRKLTVRTSGTEPLLTADEVRARYDLISILRGRIKVDELTLLSPDVRIVQDANGTSNLDPLLRTEDKRPRPGAKEPPQLEVQNIQMKNGHVRLQKTDRSGILEATEFSNLDVSFDRLQNGQSGKVTLASGLKFSRSGPPAPQRTNDALEARMSGSFDFALDPALLPKQVKGDSRLEITRTEGAYADFNGLSAVLAADMTPTELRRVGLTFERAGQRLGQLQVSGPFNIDKSEARLKIDVQSIDRQVLNLFSLSRGWDFGTSTFNASSVLDLSRGWKLIVLTGALNGRQLSLVRNQQATPALDLVMEYQTQVNLDDQTALVQKLNLIGKRDQKELLTASLDKPMNITWAPRARGFTESNFQLAVRDLQLSDWAVVLGTNAPAGQVNLNLNVLARQDAKQLTTRLAGTIQDLTAQIGSNRIQHAFAKIEAENFLEDFRMADLRSFSFEVQQGGKPLARGSGSGNYDLTRKQGTAQMTSEVALAALLQQVPVSGVRASSGVLNLSTAFTHNSDKDSATGALALKDFTGACQEYEFDHFQGVLDYSFDLTGPLLQLYRATLTVRQGFESGGSFDLTGKINLTNQAAQITFKAVDLNQNALRPFLSGALGEKKLVSINLSGNGSASYDPSGDSALKGDFDLGNWVVQDPRQTLPATPLSARLQLDGTWRNPILDLRQCTISLSPTPRAKNQLQLQAKLDLNKTNATPGRINLTAESIDVTSYYDLFAGRTNSPKSTAPASPAANTEPAPVHLPVSDVTAGIKIDRLFFRQIAVSNLLAEARVQNSQVAIKPLRMSLNGAPVNGTVALDLDVPGYTYDLSLQADRVPVEPLASSFSTNRTGSFKGDLLAAVQIKGAGVTGPNLRKNLNGQVALTVTNMNLEIVGAKTRRVLEPIAMVLNVPEILQTPLNWIDARGAAGQGEIKLDKFAVLSSAFYAESQGTIPIADVLTNSSLNLPVQLALRRSLAEKARLVPPDAPTNTAYVTLPTFVKITGTLGDPKSQTDKLVIAGLLARSASRFIPNVGGDAGKILEGVGNILGGRAGTSNINPPNTAPSATTAPPPPSNPTAELLQGLGSLLGGKRAGGSTNPVATNATPQTSTRTNTSRGKRLSPLDILQALPPAPK